MSTLLEHSAPPAKPVRRAGRGSGWGPAVRIAGRELRRTPGRTLLVLLMVLLPVTAVVTLDTLVRTAEVDVVEALPSTLGDAEARIEPHGDGRVLQTPDLGRVDIAADGPAALTEADVRRVLPGSTLLPVRSSRGERRVRTADGRASLALLLGLDLRDPAARGPFQVLAGRAPSTTDEVAVAAPLERFGFPPGSTLRLPDGSRRTVVGTVAVPSELGLPRAVLGLPEALGLAQAPLAQVYASGPPVLWDDVLELNELGATVLSRAVVLDPPPGHRVPDLEGSTPNASEVAIVGLVVVIALLEVVLLAGPAFAVGARRQRRALALLAATGGEPRHVRRVVLAQGLLVGGLAAVVGVLLGIGLAAVLRAPLTAVADATWGPFDVHLRDVVLVAAFGAGSALLAAVVPAVVAGRQPVVAALQGRRLLSAPTAGASTLGLGLLGLGTLACVASLRGQRSDILVAFSALPTVLGAALLAPALLAGLGRLAGRLPLPLRYAVRDADRQRGRTAPAVAAVAATVAGVVALGTSVTSDRAEQRASWTPAGPPGTAVAASYAEGADWPLLARAARAALPAEPVVVLRGLRLEQPAGAPGGPLRYETLQVCRPTGGAACARPHLAVGGTVGAEVLVGVGALDALAPLLDPVGLPDARRAVAAGGVAVPALDTPTIELRRSLVRQDPLTGAEDVEREARVTAPAVLLRPRAGLSPVAAVVGEHVAARLGGAQPVGLLVGRDLSTAEEDRLEDALARVDSAVEVRVERGYQEGSAPLVLLLLGLAAGVLVLGGTFAATALALVEARQDLALLAAVGAPPGARRAVAAAYAFVLALVGAVLGAAAGLVPGLAGAVAITDGYLPPGLNPSGPLEFVRVPWALLALVLVALPLLAGCAAAATAGRRRPAADR